MRGSRAANWLLAVVLGASSWILGNAIHVAYAGYSPASTFGNWSYDDSSCSTITDPVSIVFTWGNGYYNHPYTHASLADHMGMTNEDGAGQYFLDDYGCSSTDDGAATPGNDRTHMRWETAATVSDGQSYAATPHVEDWVWNIWPPFTGHHCVRPGGFTSARSSITYWFAVSSHQHSYNSNNYWGNTTAILKCDGQYVSSDGYVWYIHL